MKSKNRLIQIRRKRVRSKLTRGSARPRLSVHRTSKHIYAQIIDDQKNQTIAATSDTAISSKSKTTKTDKASQVGKLIATLALKKKIIKVSFDRGSYKYHGRVKALAQAARKQGLKF